MWWWWGSNFKPSNTPIYLLWILSNFPSSFSEQIGISDNISISFSLTPYTKIKITSSHHCCLVYKQGYISAFTLPILQQEFSWIYRVALYCKPFKSSCAGITKTSSSSRINYILANPEICYHCHFLVQSGHPHSIFQDEYIRIFI